VPLSRLTYSAYLCHPLVIKWLAGTTQTYYTWSYAMLLSRWCLNVVLTWCAALLLWLAAERPALTLLNSAIRR
jgi:peptidoglycan/LPS O-acetylase OafA/YrhL